MCTPKLHYPASQLKTDIFVSSSSLSTHFTTFLRYSNSKKLFLWGKKKEVISSMAP